MMVKPYSEYYIRRFFVQVVGSSREKIALQGAVDEVEWEELSVSVTSMSFFDRLQEEGESHSLDFQYLIFHLRRRSIMPINRSSYSFGIDSPMF